MILEPNNIEQLLKKVHIIQHDEHGLNCGPLVYFKTYSKPLPVLTGPWGNQAWPAVIRERAPC